MGNLRPAPAELTPQRIDMLLASIDRRERAYTIDTLQRLGLPDEQIAQVVELARKIDRKPLAVAGGLIGSALEAIRTRL